MKQKLLPSLLASITLLIGINIIAKSFGVNLKSNPLYYGLLITLPAILMFLHATQTLSLPRSMFFFGLAFTIGLTAEMIGTQYGTVFGGYYVYKQTALMLGDIPFIVPIYWAVFIYSGYTIINSFLVWINKEKPSLKNRLWEKLPLLILLDGFVIVAIDLFMDPIEVRAGAWTWVSGGSYFGVPIGNFVGWFMVATITTIVFRVFEYFKPLKIKVADSTYLFPVIAYALLYLYFLSKALYLNLPSLVLIGSAAMLPIVCVNILLFSYRKF